MEFHPPNDEEIAAIETIKSRIKTEAPDCVKQHNFNYTTILRFYRGRKNDLEKAYKGLVRHVEWRKEYNVDDIPLSKYDNEFSKSKITIGGYDHFGRPCVNIFVAKHNKNDRNMEEMRFLIIAMLEQALKLTNPIEERLVICFYLNDFSMNCMDFEVVKLLIDILQYNYPETLSVALIVNSPWVFSGCWQIIKPWLDPVTASKAIFVNQNQLKSYINLDIADNEQEMKEDADALPK
eukprot:gene12869-17245_t